MSHSKKNWVRPSNVFIGFRVKFLLFVSDFNETWKSDQWELSCSMRTGRWTDGQTDRNTELIVAFWTFPKPLKIVIINVMVFWDESHHRQPSLVHGYQSFGRTFVFQFQISFYLTVFLSGFFRNSGTHLPNCMLVSRFRYILGQSFFVKILIAGFLTLSRLPCLIILPVSVYTICLSQFLLFSRITTKEFLHITI
jgi:hypothetical protein